MARPTAFKPEYVEQARKLCELAATDADVADFFKVNVSTIYRWANSHPEFCEALKAGKDAADERVVRSLFHRAVGYTHEAVKIFMPANASAPVYAPYTEHVPPDTTAAIFWLKNRRRSEWRDRHEHEHAKAGEFDRLSDAELEERAKAVARAIVGDSGGTAETIITPTPDRVH